MSAQITEDINIFLFNRNAEKALASALYDPKTNGERLKEIRIFRGLTVEEVSSETDISCEALNSYERGTRNPRDEIKVMLCDYYGVSVQSIFYPRKRELIGDCVLTSDEVRIIRLSIKPDAVAEIRNALFREAARRRARGRCLFERLKQAHYTMTALCLSMNEV